MSSPKWFLACAFLSAVLLFSGQAQTPLGSGTPRLPPPRAVAAAPAPLLKIEDADPASVKAVALESLDISAVLSGPLSRTTITMTFRNSLNRQFEGELEFPLPEGASKGPCAGRSCGTSSAAWSNLFHCIRTCCARPHSVPQA